jgi:hypothetical protein
MSARVFFKFLVIPLYTKIRREEVLDHFTRGRIYGMIESSPGVHYTLIKKKVGVGNGTLTYHLSTLEREGFIRAEIVSYDDFISSGGSIHAVREKGHFRLEGKTYQVKDGDMVNFRFNV